MSALLRPAASAFLHPWFSLCGSIVLGAVAQIALKRGANTRRNSRVPRSGSIEVRLWRMVTSPWTLAWAACFAVATALWVVALGTLDISYAYPLLGFGYVLVTGMAALLLGERVSGLHWFAVLLIALGAAVVAKSA